jgi:hypothetical protein
MEMHGDPKGWHTLVGNILAAPRSIRIRKKPSGKAIFMPFGCRSVHLPTLVLAFIFTANSEVWASQTTAAAIFGSVVNEHGAPIADARIAATSPSAKVAGRTDAQGHFVLLGLPAGTYAITVRESWYQTPPAPIVLHHGERKHVILRIAGRSEFFQTIGSVVAQTQSPSASSSGLGAYSPARCKARRYDRRLPHLPDNRYESRVL